MSNIIDSIKLSGVTYTIQGSGGGGNPTIELTQAQYDALVTAGTVQADTYYIITDASGGDLSNYMSSAQTMSAITEATSGKVDSNVYTAYTASTDTAIQGKQDTLVSGTNIKTINNESLLGSGNITIQGGGGGKAIEAGRGISVTTGETADTVSFNLPISAGSKTNSVVIGGGQATQNLSLVHGLSSTARGVGSNVFGYNCDAGGNYAFVAGEYLGCSTESGAAFGKYNKSIGYPLFTVGNGTADNARHNAFEIRQNGDIYITSGGTDIKLQDNLGGGSITVDTALDSGSTNPVENRVIYNKIDEVEQVTARALNDLDDRIIQTEATIGDINTILSSI